MQKDRFVDRVMLILSLCLFLCVVVVIAIDHYQPHYMDGSSVQGKHLECPGICMDDDE